MLFVIQVLQGLLGIVGLVCLVLVLIKMFQSGETTLGIVCIVLLLCFGIGYLIAFIFGWINANKWDIKNVMWNLDCGNYCRTGVIGHRLFHGSRDDSA